MPHLDAEVANSTERCVGLMVEAPDDLIPVRRPHFELRNDGLFFLLSRRPHAKIDQDDRILWNRIDGVRSVGDLRRGMPDAAVRLRRFHDLKVCELAAPHFRANRRRVLVIEPHMDDAILSVGGLMWGARNDCEFTVATVAGRSNFTTYYFLDRDFFDVDRVSALRQAESALALRLLGGRHVALDQPEALLRFQPGNWTLDWCRGHRKQVDVFNMHASTEAEIESWTAAVAALIDSTEAEEIWLPLGVGSHTDHELARNACLRALHRITPQRHRTLYFYQEVPYSIQFPRHTAMIVDAIAQAGGRLEPRPSDISESFADKLQLVSIFGSQFKPSYMHPRVEAAARLASPSGNGLYEMRFQMTTVPGPLDPVDVYSGRDEVERVQRQLTSWYQRHRDAHRIRILSPVPVSRWQEDLTFLLEVFAAATLEVHVSAEYADETRRFESPRLDVRRVAGPKGAWLKRLAAITTRPLPTILLTGARRRAFAPLATRLLVGCDALAAATMNHLVLALQRIGSSSARINR